MAQNSWAKNVGINITKVLVTPGSFIHFTDHNINSPRSEKSIFKLKALFINLSWIKKSTCTLNLHSMMGFWVLVLISKLTLMLQVVTQGNVNGLKPIVNFLTLSICKKTFLFSFKLRKDLVLLHHFHKTSFKCTLLSHHKRDFQTFYHLVGTLMKPIGQLKTLPLPIEVMMIGR